MSATKISVIIPLYNAERFIWQCLISVLASKFAEYEVLVVDDCSTDNSVAEVEKLLPHFDGRLKILSTEKNSGGAGIPRNVGMENALGKYVTFIDNDDMILPTALGDFFAAAEKFHADVVYAEKYFAFNDGQKFRAVACTAVEELVETPTLEPADLLTRIRRDIAKKFYILPWGKLYRRDFLIKNKIDFPQMRYAEDLTFCFKCLCLSKKFLRIPQITNVHRENDSSTGMVVTTSAKEGVHIWLKIFLTNMQLLDDFMGGLKFFKSNPAVRRDVLTYYIGVHFEMLQETFPQMMPHEVQKIFLDELQDPELDTAGKNLVAAYFFTERAMNQNFGG